MDLGKHFHADRSALYLIASNLLTIFLAVYQKWDLSEIMWIYWGQSVIIGYFNYRRILDLRQFSTSGFSINNKPAEPTRKTQKSTANFFAIHYGFFHLIYMVFLVNQTKSIDRTSVLFIMVCTVMFLFNHRFSYLYNKERDMHRTPNIGTIMFFPYLRIIPMHLTIIIGQSFAKGSSKGLILFLGLKTLADLVMHMIEHADARKRDNEYASNE